jgi:hypothetical protein
VISTNGALWVRAKSYNPILGLSQIVILAHLEFARCLFQSIRGVSDSYPDLEGLLGKTYDNNSRLDTTPQARPGVTGGSPRPLASDDGPGHLPEQSVDPHPADGQRLPRPEGSCEGVPGDVVPGEHGVGSPVLPDRGSGKQPDLQQLASVGHPLEHGGVPEDASEPPTNNELDGAPSIEPGPGRPGGAPQVVGESDGSGGVGAIVGPYRWRHEGRFRSRHQERIGTELSAAANLTDQLACHCQPRLPIQGADIRLKDPNYHRLLSANCGLSAGRNRRLFPDIRAARKLSTQLSTAVP